jgi:nicotinate phosphoribosyltransferase
MDFAKRAHDHNFRMDPIVRNLTDTDFYKPLMQQFLWRRFPGVNSVWKQKNRTTDVPLAEQVTIEELREQFDHARTLKHTKSELINYAGQTFSGVTGIFRSGYIDFLRTYQLPEYSIEHERAYNGSVGYNTGQYDIQYAGKLCESTGWEIPSLTITNELRNRHLLRQHTKSELDIMYARAKVKLYDKLLALTAPELEGISVTEFGTRRRHSFLWQEWVVQTMAEVLGVRFGGTSNVYLAMQHGLEARGTNAHELPMAYAAMADGDEALKNSPYMLARDWQADHPEALRIMLPDTYGSTSYFENSPSWLSDWAGFRPDSKKPIPAIEEGIAYWKLHSQPVAEKLVIPNDGLDVHLPHQKAHGEDIPTIYLKFKGQVRQSFGWGTLATNDFHGCSPKGYDFMKPISIVCKLQSVDGKPCVKLSDNYDKAIGPPEEIARYHRVFGTKGMVGAPVFV